MASDPKFRSESYGRPPTPAARLPWLTPDVGPDRCVYCGHSIEAHDNAVPECVISFCACTRVAFDSGPDAPEVDWA